MQLGENPLFTDSMSNAKVVVPFMTTKIGANGGGGGASGVSGGMATYKRRDMASIKVEDDVVCMMGNWILEDN